jgi:cellulose biosynthesis protein BcsQ
VRSLVLFNNKGGVGKTTLAFNIAHMMARQRMRVVLLDYDPQCNLSAIALSEEKLVDLWEDESSEGTTAARAIDLVRRGKGDVREPVLREIADNLWLLPGDLALSRFEQVLAESWGQIHQADNERALHVTTSLQRLADRASQEVDAHVALLDVGPNLGALNRSALLAADGVVMPVAPDLFSLQGLKNIGPTLREWRDDWQRAAQRTPESPQAHLFAPLGYIVQQHLARVDRPVRAYEGWARQVPRVFHEHVLGEPEKAWPPDRDSDPYCIALLKHFASLVPYAQVARKPIFDLKQADGITGGQIQAVSRARNEFQDLVVKLLRLLEI